MSDTPTSNEPAQRVLNDRERFAQMLRDYHAKVGGWIKKLWPSDPGDDYEKSEEYQAALNYYQQFKAQEGVHYDAAITYAQQLHERYDKTDKALDEKADSIIKYLGGGSALVTFGALLSLKTDTRATCILGLVAMVCLIPSLAAAIMAVSHAIRVRRPRASGSLPPVKFAIDMAEFYKTEDQVKLNLWLIFHPLCEAAYFRNLQKAKLVNSTHNCYQWAMILLLIPVVGMAITLIALLPK